MLQFLEHGGGDSAQLTTSMLDGFTPEVLTLTGARRAGRGRNIGRAERAEIWQLAERFTQRLDRLGRQTWDQVAERAARLQIGREQRIQNIARHREEAGGLDNIHLQDGSGGWLRHRYRHIVVDEAQDLRPAHWKMLRAMAPRGADDLFLVGDTHQRIYKNQVTLGSLGVNIRGRSSKLSLSYRTTRQILRSALGVLGETTYDDLDGSEETLAGYRSVLSGGLPAGHAFPDWASEREGVAALIEEWAADSDTAIPHEQIAICVPTNQMAAETAYTLKLHGIDSVEIRSDGPNGSTGVHDVPVQGLEYQRVVIAGVTDGLVPREAVNSLRDSDPVRHRHEIQRARSRGSACGATGGTRAVQIGRPTSRRGTGWAFRARRRPHCPGPVSPPRRAGSDGFGHIRRARDSAVTALYAGGDRHGRRRPRECGIVTSGHRHPVPSAPPHGHRTLKRVSSY